MEWAMVPPGRRLDILTDGDEGRFLVSGVSKAIENAKNIGLDSSELEVLEDLVAKSKNPMDY